MTLWPIYVKLLKKIKLVKAKIEAFLHRKFHMEVEAVSHCLNSHSTIILHLRVAHYMCHFIYAIVFYKANATCLVSPDFAMNTT